MVESEGERVKKKKRGSVAETLTMGQKGAVVVEDTEVVRLIISF